MRGLLLLTLIFAGSSALAHPGHLNDVAGHDHWIAGAAIGLAGALALWAYLKGRKDNDTAAEDEEALEEDSA